MSLPYNFTRPKPGDTDDDLMKMQQEFEASQRQQAGSAGMVRMARKGQQKPSAPEKREDDFRAGRFMLDLDSIEEERAPVRVLFDVTEQNIDWLGGGRADTLARHALRHSKEDGFPEAIDLSKYYRKENPVRAPPGKSYFAAEFDRLHAGEASGSEEKEEEQTVEEEEEVDTDQLSRENTARLTRMSSAEVTEARREIEERLDPKLIEFLKSRHKKKVQKPVEKAEEAKPKVSKFKAARAAGAENKPVEVPPTPTPPPVVEDIVKQLEVLEEFADRKDEEKYNRLAADAVQLDFASKCMRTMLPRQQQNVIKLFDGLKHKPEGREDDALTAHARGQIDKIKELYLEEVDTDGHRAVQFARGLNAVVDGCWMLVPIRRVLDAIATRKDGEATADDVELVRLSLLWTVLLLRERQSVFAAWVDTNELFVRLCEVFLIGREVLSDDWVEGCVRVLLDDHVLKGAQEGRLNLRLTQAVAGLDAFMPFWEEVVRAYGQWSLGDVEWARALLIGAYLNTAEADALACRQAIWAPGKHTARMITMPVEPRLLSAIRSSMTEQAVHLETRQYEAYSTMLGAYAAAVRDEAVTRERNPMMFAIAADELGRFVQRHSAVDGSADPERAREFDVIVEIVRQTVKDKIAL